MINYRPFFLAQFLMFRNRLSAETGSAVLGFALVFPLVAFIFVSTADLITGIVRRETATAVSQKVMREGVRLPRTEDVKELVANALEQREFDATVEVSQSTRNTARLIQIDIENTVPQFTSRVFGIYEQEYE